VIRTKRPLLLLADVKSLIAASDQLQQLHQHCVACRTATWAHAAVASATQQITSISSQSALGDVGRPMMHYAD
jgi:hypothetical protein